MTALHRQAEASPAASGRSASIYVPEIDALRALAMSAVIIFHCGLMPFGWMGVWLFYVVSGFSVTTSLIGERRPAKFGVAVRGFYLRRALRIWPVYYAFIGANVLCLLAWGWFEPLQDVPWLLSFTYNIKMMIKDYTPANDWTGFAHLWTLSVEQQFYVVFPLILLLRGRAARAVALLCVIALAPLVRAGFGQYLAGLGWDVGQCAFGVYVFAPAHFDAFAIGTLIALFRPAVTADRRIARAVLVLAGVATFAYVSVYLTLGVAQAGRLSLTALRNIVSGNLFGQGREVFVYLVPTWIGAAALTGILSGQPLWLRIGRLPGLQAIGRVSYGGYLYHIPVVKLLVFCLPAFVTPLKTPAGVAWHAAMFVCAYPITVAVAWLSFTYFEKPIATSGKRYLQAARARFGLTVRP